MVGDILDIELSESQPFKADSGAVLSMPVAAGIARQRTVYLGHWNTARLTWEKVAEAKGDSAVAGKVYGFSKYAVLMGSLPLGAYDFVATPNPFTALDPWGLQLGYKVSSDVSSQVGVRVEVYNMMGDKVYESQESQLSKGRERRSPAPTRPTPAPPERRAALGPFVWDGRDTKGVLCRNGRYLLKLIVKDGQGKQGIPEEGGDAEMNDAMRTLLAAGGALLRPPFPVPAPPTSASAPGRLRAHPHRRPRNRPGRGPDRRALPAWRPSSTIPPPWTPPGLERRLLLLRHVRPGALPFHRRALPPAGPALRGGRGLAPERRRGLFRERGAAWRAATPAAGSAWAPPTSCASPAPGAAASTSCDPETGLGRQVDGSALGLLGFDVGATVQPFGPKYVMGVAFKDLLSRISWNTDNEAGTAQGDYAEYVPVTLRYGFLFDPDPFLDLVVDFEPSLYHDGRSKLATGIEMVPFELLKDGWVKDHIHDMLALTRRLWPQPVHQRGLPPPSPWARAWATATWACASRWIWPTSGTTTSRTTTTCAWGSC